MIMKRLLIFGFAAFLLASCGPTSTLTKGERYTQFYEEKPGTILVMPPINNSTNVEAKDLLYTSISRPLIEAGYYVLSPNLVMDVLKAESAYDSELFIDGNMSMFNQYFGADAVIFSVIDTWAKKGMGIETKIRYIMKSAHTNEVIFERSCDLYLNLQVNSGTGGVLGALVDLAASAILTVATDHIVAARKCNYYIFNDLPYGKYSPNFGLDKEATALPKDVTARVQ